MESEEFYGRIPREADFVSLTEPGLYRALPDDWQVGTADVTGSTRHVAEGRYKTVNTVGAASISAVMNALGGAPFPFVFGGDGAGFAVAADQAGAARAALAAVARWAEAEFGMGLRVAMVPVSDIRAAGHDVRVARFAASPGVDYAMFAGGGLGWAEAEMKAGRHLVAMAPEGTLPDLTGLSCRWAHMPSRLGAIVSVVVAPVAGAAPQEVARVYRSVVTLAQGLERAGHPAGRRGMIWRWPPAGARLEAHAARGKGSFAAAYARALFEPLVATVMNRFNLTLGGFNARQWALDVAANADFRKLDDGLKMTLDCDPDTRARLEALLERAAGAGVIRYGIATQDEAMMTCIVPSIATDDHLHFIDGAAGGYTLAAARMKGG